MRVLDARRPGDGLFELVRDPDQAGCVRVDDVPGRPQADATRNTIEERQPEVALEVADVRRDRRLADAETLGRTSHMLVLRDCDKHAQLMKVEPFSSAERTGHL
jgi:hypothetical protein